MISLANSNFGRILILGCVCFSSFVLLQRGFIHCKDYEQTRACIMHDVFENLLSVLVQLIKALTGRGSHEIINHKLALSIFSNNTENKFILNKLEWHQQ